MKTLLELTTRTYLGKEYKEYIKAVSDELNPDEEDWQRDARLASISDSEVKLPTAHTSRIRIDPDKILSIVETFSMEEMHNNPDNLTFDILDIYMEDGMQITAEGTLEQFDEKVKKYQEDEFARMKAAYEQVTALGLTPSMNK